MKSCLRIPLVPRGLGIILATLSGAFVYGDEEEDTRKRQQLESRTHVLESKMNQISTRTVHGNIGAKTASASPQIEGANWFLSAELLWWHVDEGGTDYAQLWKTPPLTGSPSVDNKRLKFKWDYGFRAGIGKVFGHDGWDLFLNFTWFKSANQATSSLHGGAFLTPLMQTPFPLLASAVKTRWKIHFYALDLNLGRSYFISPKLSFHPFVGLKTAWIRQKAKTHSTIFSPDLFTLRSKDKNDFWGIGPSLGSSGKWFLDYGFHLFGTLAGAMLWGNFDTHYRENSSSVTPGSNYGLDIHQVSPMVQLQIGLGYETNLYHNSYHLAVNVGYENQYWWSQNQMPQFTQFLTGRFRRQAEDLSFQGVTAQVRFDF